VRWLLPWPCLALAACEGVQSVHGRDAYQGDAIYRLFELFLWVAGISYLLVMLFLAAALLRHFRKHRTEPVSSDKPMGRALAVWAVLITAGLSLLAVTSFFLDRDLAYASAKPELRIKVTANQWWWDVEYDDPVAANRVRTANELHLPVDVPVEISLRANDVIHSFWVPSLTGKQDLIPGRETDVAVRPGREGYYRGQCAEFCGMQHAHMALDVIVESREAFEAWKQRQLTPAPAPQTPLAQAGYHYVMTRECSTCHAIGGTPASAQVAPDLTHVAGRRSIAAGTFPMTRGHLYAWIADPQTAKPGNRMPTIGLEPSDLHAVVAYLETLK
jgi:cytochrome c oxidase subunit 2